MIRTRKLNLRIAVTLAAGMFSIVPVGYAMPQGGTSDTAKINTSSTQMDITSGTANNVVNWDSFSIAKGETVQFDKGEKINNYLNIVKGNNMSEIYGTMKGGNNVYLINPNGILFGAGAQVNVGHLTASTRALDAVNTNGFDGTNALDTNVTAATGDIVNRGSLQAASVVLEGKDIRIINTADLTRDGETVLQGANVSVRAGGEAHIGYDTTKQKEDKFDILKQTEKKLVSDYADKSAANQTNSATGLKWSVTELDGKTGKSGADYMRVHNVYELQAIQDNLGVEKDDVVKEYVHYMLAQDIDAAETKNWNYDVYSSVYRGFSPLGDSDESFSGFFDGDDHKISGLTVYRNAGFAGLFGYSSGSELSNFGLVGGSIVGPDPVGGVAARVYKTRLTNVYNTSAVGGGNYMGGLIGYMMSSTLTNAYNTGDVSAYGGEIGGAIGSMQDSTLTNVYSTGAVSGCNIVGGLIGIIDKSGNLNNVYSTGAARESQTETWPPIWVGGLIGFNDGGTLTNAYYATTDVKGNKINYNHIYGTGVPLADLQQKSIKDYGFDSAVWHTYAKGAEGTLKVTTPMLNFTSQQEISPALLAHTAVQHGTATNPFCNIYKTNAMDMDMADFAKLGVNEIAVTGDLTIKNFQLDTDAKLYLGCDGTLTLQNPVGFSLGRGVALKGFAIDLTSGSAMAGEITDYATVNAIDLNITAQDILLGLNHTTAAKNISLDASRRAGADYAPEKIVELSIPVDVHGNSVSYDVPDYKNGVVPADISKLKQSGTAAIAIGMTVKNIYDLQAMQNNLVGSYILVGDIDASATKSWNYDAASESYLGFSPVGNLETKFQGAFDGFRHTVKGLVINRPKQDEVGLFGYSDGAISNLGLVDGSVIGKKDVGGIAGCASDMTTVYNTSAVTGVAFVGGVAGKAYGA